MRKFWLNWRHLIIGAAASAVCLVVAFSISPAASMWALGGEAASIACYKFLMPK